MKPLSPLEKDFIGGPINLPRFWATLTWLETTYPAHGLQHYNPFQMVRLRYWQDGNIAHTYQEIADLFGSSDPGYMRSVVKRGLRIMRHSRYKLREWL